MKVEIGKYKVSFADAQSLISIAKKIDKNKEELSNNEEKAIGTSLLLCKGNVQIAEAMLRKLVLGMVPEMIRIPAGKFEMGNKNGHLNEQPVRNVNISGFGMSKYKVTNGEYRAYLMATGQKVQKSIADVRYDRYPAVNLSWDDAVNYCKWLSETTGRIFRLPTEAEWEYAARGINKIKYPWGSKRDISKELEAKPVDSDPERASQFGIMDMVGKVYEWTGDWYAEKYDPKDLTDPKGPKTGNWKVIRGGSWYDEFVEDAQFPTDSRSALRFKLLSFVKDSTVGIRVVEDLK